MVSATRFCSCSNVVSSSGNLGDSTCDRRCAANLEASLARCTWPDSGYMSGARRALTSSAGSMPLAAAWAAPFSSSVASTLKPRMKTGTEAWYMDRDMMMSSE